MDQSHRSEGVGGPTTCLSEVCWEATGWWSASGIVDEGVFGCSCDLMLPILFVTTVAEMALLFGYFMYLLSNIPASAVVSELLAWSWQWRCWILSGV